MWSPLMLGSKSAEFRLNDRDYKESDVLVMRFVDDNGEVSPKHSTLRPFRVNHIVYGPDFGIPEGYCMMSITPDFGATSDPS